MLLAQAYAYDLMCFEDIFSKVFIDPDSGDGGQQAWTPKASGSRSRIVNAFQQPKPLKFSPLLLAVSSCLLASKFSEIDDNLMIVAELLHFINNVLHTRYLTQQRLIYQDVTRAELQTLTRFQWDAYRTISLDFVELYF